MAMVNPALASPIANHVFDIIQGQEINFPFPVNSKTFTVGTFDAATGKFTYLVPTYTERFVGDEDTPGPPKPTVLKGGMVNALNVIDVTLRFNVRNRKGDFSASVLGAPAAHTATADSVEIPIGAASIVTFKLFCAGKRFTSELPLEIARSFVGAGVFELPALPVSIVYAPPVDRGKKNTARWQVSESTGNKTSLSLGKQTTTSHPVRPEFDNVNVVVSELQAAAHALDLLNKPIQNKPEDGFLDGFEGFNNPELEVVSKALNAIAGALGSSSASESQGATTTKEHSLELTVTNAQTITTDANSGGPGEGDLIHYLKNVKLAWFTSAPGRLRVTVFGHDGIAVTRAGFLKSGGQTDLDPALTGEFLKLDPFVAGGPSAPLPPERFVYLDTIDINGGEITLTETHSITKQESVETTTINTHVQKNQPGFLSFLGIGVTDENSTETQITQSSTSESEQTRTISNTIDLFAGPDERYTVEIYCDVVFGTFAYRQIGSAATPVVKGVVRTKQGKPAAAEIVTLVNRGRKFTTKADGRGRYAFRASTLKPGESSLIVAGVPQTVKLGASSLTHDIHL